MPTARELAQKVVNQYTIYRVLQKGNTQITTQPEAQSVPPTPPTAGLTPSLRSTIPLGTEKPK